MKNPFLLHLTIDYLKSITSFIDDSAFKIGDTCVLSEKEQEIKESTQDMIKLFEKELRWMKNTAR